ncbi:MAG: hypothetical protein IT384_15225 [Deltaproteobacteria bacterium]|nr:hypothetical protein [Deltaproteobacteria bacterium]
MSVPGVGALRRAFGFGEGGPELEKRMGEAAQQIARLGDRSAEERTRRGPNAEMRDLDRALESLAAVGDGLSGAPAEERARLLASRSGRALRDALADHGETLNKLIEHGLAPLVEAHNSMGLFGRLSSGLDTGTLRRLTQKVNDGGHSVQSAIDLVLGGGTVTGERARPSWEGSRDVYRVATPSHDAPANDAGLPPTLRDELSSTGGHPSTGRPALAPSSTPDLSSFDPRSLTEPEAWRLRQLLAPILAIDERGLLRNLPRDVRAELQAHVENARRLSAELDRGAAPQVAAARAQLPSSGPVSREWIRGLKQKLETLDEGGIRADLRGLVSRYGVDTALDPRTYGPEANRYRVGEPRNPKYVGEHSPTAEITIRPEVHRRAISALDALARGVPPDRLSRDDRFAVHVLVHEAMHDVNPGKYEGAAKLLEEVTTDVVTSRITRDAFGITEVGAYISAREDLTGVIERGLGVRRQEAEELLAKASEIYRSVGRQQLGLEASRLVQDFSYCLGPHVPEEKRARVEKELLEIASRAE